MCLFFRLTYFLGEGVVDFMPLFRCIYFFGEGVGFMPLFRCIYFFIYILILFNIFFLLFWGVGLNASF